MYPVSAELGKYPDFYPPIEYFHEKILKIVILYFLLRLIDMITLREIFESYFNDVDRLKTFLRWDSKKNCQK